MTEKELKEYIINYYPIENEGVEWKDYSNLKNTLCGHEGDDVISYVSALANMNGGALVIGVADKTLDVVGIQHFGSYTLESAKSRICEKCQHLDSEKLEIIELNTDDTDKCVWIINIPKHKNRIPVYAHNKAWQRIGESLFEMKRERLETIISEITIDDDWSVMHVGDGGVHRAQELSALFVDQVGIHAAVLQLHASYGPVAGDGGGHGAQGGEVFWTVQQDLIIVGLAGLSVHDALPQGHRREAPQCLAFKEGHALGGRGVPPVQILAAVGGGEDAVAENGFADADRLKKMGIGLDAHSAGSFSF